MSLLDNKDKVDLQRNQNLRKPKDNTITDHFGKNTARYLSFILDFAPLNIVFSKKTIKNLTRQY